MKHILQLIAAIVFVITFTSIIAGRNEKNQQNMSVENNTPLFPSGEKLTNGYFTGDAYLTTLLTRDKNNDFVIGNVTFKAGARTNWHTHPKGQILIVTEGEGFYQEKEKPARRIKKGDVVNIPENVQHWHGASASSSMVHIAITNFKGEGNVVWLRPVTDAEYDEVNKNN